MASISSLSGSSSVSSIYGNRNVLSGLASGLDTESMIENSIQGYKLKIENLIAKQTKLTWKQDAYRSITDKMIALKNKYTSYTSKTNLSSPSFFNNAVTTTTNGKNADKVSASGRTTSDIQINAVKQLASAAKYTVDGARLMGAAGGTVAAGDALNLDTNVQVNNIVGDMTFHVEGLTDDITITFGEGEKEIATTEDLMGAINDKLAQVTVNYDGKEVKASQLFNVWIPRGGDPNELVVRGLKNATLGTDLRNKVKMGSISDQMGTAGLTASGTTLKVPEDKSNFRATMSAKDYLKGKTIDITLGETSGQITIEESDLTPEDGQSVTDKLVSSLQNKLKDKFGGKVSVEKTTKMVNGELKESLNFISTASDELTVSSNAGDVLGMSGTLTGKSGTTTAAGHAMKLGEKVEASTIAGSMTLTVGTKKLTVDFDSDEVYKDAESLAKAINEKLADQNVNTRTQGTVSGDNLVKAVAKDGKITFEAGSAAEKGDSIWISGATGNFQKTLGITAGTMDKGDKSITVPSASKLFVSQDAAEYLTGKTVNVTLDGVTKKISLGDLTLGEGETIEQKVFSNLQKGIKDAFGSKVSVEMATNAKGERSLKFSANTKNSTLKVSSDAGSVLGLGDGGVTNYMDTSATMKDLLGDEKLSALKPIKVADKDVKEGKDGTYHDKDGNTVEKTKDGSWIRVDGDSKPLYALTINGKQVGAFNEDTTLETFIASINNSDAGVKVNYSKMTNRFTFSATETGSQGRIDFGDEDSLAHQLFGAGKRTYIDNNGVDSGVLADASGQPLEMRDGQEKFYVKYVDGKYYKTSDPAGSQSLGELDKANAQDARIIEAALEQSVMKGFVGGTDAIFSTTVNGEEMTLVRSNNTIDLDGLSVTLKGTFNDVDGDGNSNFVQDENGDYTFEGMDKIESDSPVTFTTKANADDLVKTLTEFVDEYNKIITEVHDAFSTMPAEKNTSSHTRYEPLTDDEKADMSDKEIERYEEKAKQGILFGDSDLRRAYDSLRNTIAVYGDDRKAMEAIGLTTTYENGVTTLSLDEAKLREALENNPDSVRQVFTDSRENGGKTDGIMARVKQTLDTYASTSIGNYGVLVNLAGTKTSSLTLMNNYVQKQIDNLDDQIDTWQSRMSDKIDYYSRQFTALEQLMAQFNSQSSALAGMMGGGSY